MVWCRESCYEEVLRQLRQGLAKCYFIAFENRGAVTDATITPHMLHFVKKLVSTFGIGIGKSKRISIPKYSSLKEAEFLIISVIIFYRKYC